MTHPARWGGGGGSECDTGTAHVSVVLGVRRSTRCWLVQTVVVAIAAVARASLIAVPSRSAASFSSRPAGGAAPFPHRHHLAHRGRHEPHPQQQEHSTPDADDQSLVEMVCVGPGERRTPGKAEDAHDEQRYTDEEHDEHSSGCTTGDEVEEASHG